MARRAHSRMIQVAAGTVRRAGQVLLMGLEVILAHLPGVQEEELLQGDVPSSAHAYPVSVQAVEEQMNIAVPLQPPTGTSQLWVREAARLIPVKLPEHQLHRSEVLHTPCFEGHEDPRGVRVEFQQRDVPGEIRVQGSPGTSDIAFELQLLAGVFELQPGDAVGIVPVEKGAPRRKRVRIPLPDQLVQLLQSLRVGVRVDELGGLPGVQPLQVATGHKAAPEVVQGCDKQRPGVGVVGPAQVSQRPQEGRE
mmetsp:Transcript_59311/g.141391  ORF Transcript_59311/g.141391 Transcript_59311/m.141391 type:complete len:251 (-) Transcript_59311:247-999(-)